MSRRGRQLELAIRSWGGRRPGAGRKAAARRSVPHRRRPLHDTRYPAHVTLRAAPGVPSLRGTGVFPLVRAALAAASGARFRILHFSVQADHLHVVVEADEPTGLARGLQGLAIRVAKAVNRARRRRGSVWGDRYHARVLKTPREMRNALVYVLNNWRKHVPGARGLDPRSSAAWFSGWSTGLPRPARGSPVAVARTWLARVGWRRHGAIDVDEVPKRRVRARE